MKICILAICFICFISVHSQAQSKKKNITPAADSRGTTTYDAGAENSIFSDSKKVRLKVKPPAKRPVI